MKYQWLGSKGAMQQDTSVATEAQEQAARADDVTWQLQ